MATFGHISYESDSNRGITLAIPQTAYITANTALVSALRLYLSSHEPMETPEALFTAAQTLSLGDPLGTEAEEAVSVLLGVTSGWAEGFCPSCYAAVRDGNEWDEEYDEPDTTGFVAGDLSGDRFKWTSGMGMGGRDTCSDCADKSMVANTKNALGNGHFSTLPRLLVHPSEWLTVGHRPDNP